MSGHLESNAMSDVMPVPASYFGNIVLASSNFPPVSLTNLLLLERRALGVVPNRGKGVSLARLRVHRNLTRRILAIGPWIRADRQHMLPGRQRRVVILIDGQNRNLDAINGEINRLVYAKVR